MRATVTRTMVAIVASATVVTACGGADDAASDGGATTVPASTSTTAPATPTVAATAESPPPASTAAAASPTADDAASTTTAASTVPVTAPPEPAYDLAGLTALVAQLDTAVADGSLAPLSVAEELIGFPVAVPVPQGSAVAGVDATLRRADDGSVDYTFEYRAVAPGGLIPDVDISLDDNGPGSVHVIDVFDPIMTALGFTRTASTASDPGDPGGPNSVNHVYEPADRATSIAGATAELGNVFVWADEDVTGAASGLDPAEPVGGYRVDVDAMVLAGQPIAVPLLAALAESLPVPDTAELVDGAVRLQSRGADSFDADRGTNYVTVTLTWQVADTTVDSIAADLADGSSLTTDVWLPAEPSFSDEGAYQLAEMYAYDGTDMRQPVLLLQRYEGLWSIDAPDEEGGPVVVSIDVALNPNDVELSPPDT